MNTIRGLLPGGLVDEQGAVHRQVELRSLSGHEELILANREGREVNALVTTLLSQCVRRLGDINPVSEEEMRNLLVADRQYLFLKLREATFGDQVQATIVCPNPNCGNKVDIDFSIADIPIKILADKGPCYQMRLSPEFGLVNDDGETYTEVVFRLPNGGDQEALAPLIDEDESRAAQALLARCVQRFGPLENPGVQVIEQLAPQAKMEIEQQIELIAPALEPTMSGDCPECGAPFVIPFNLMKFFWSELKSSRDSLLREVHYLAFHYHWSEGEIMAMPREKRRMYIELLAEEIQRMNGEV